MAGGGSELGDLARFLPVGLDRLERAVVVTDREGTIRLWNGAAEELYGWPAEEVVGRTSRDVLAPMRVDDADLAMTTIHAGECWTGEFALTHRDGRELVVEVLTVPVVVDGDVVAMVGYSSDRTPDRILASELEANRQRLEMTTAQGRVGTWKTDLATGRTSWDSGLARIYGVSNGFGGTVEEVVALMHPDDRDRVQHELLSLVAGDIDEYVIESRALAADGEVRWIEARGRVLRDDDGRATGTVGVGIDITDRKRAEVALTVQSARLRRLATSSLALGSTLAVAEILQRTAEEARDLFEAQSATVTANAGVLGPQPVTLRTGDVGGADSERRGVEAALIGRDEADLGRIQVQPADGASFDGDDEAILVQLARIAAAALENARSYERERAAAQSLQRRLLPHALPAIAGADFAARYVPAGAVDVGGDWYDVVDLGEGRFVLAVGDVMGRGVEAASVMGQVRLGFRAYALEGLRPADVLARLGRLMSSLAMESFSTLVVARIDLPAMRMTWAAAGHPPLLLRRGGAVEILEVSPGPPVGIGSDPATPGEAVVALAPEDVVIAYTDGLVERRDLALEVGIADVARHLTGVTLRRAGDVADHALTVSDGVIDDDVAVLALRILPRRDDETITLPPELSSVSEARHFASDALRRWALTDLEDDVSVVLSELVTNAVLHAGTAIGVSVTPWGGGVRVEVRDEDPMPGSATRLWFAPHARRDRELPADLAFDLDALESLLVEEATTGRGLRIVAAVADDWDVEVHSDPPGKTVWAEVGTGARREPQWFDDRADDAVAGDAPSEGIDLRGVRLVAVPVRLALASDANLDDLVREFQVLTLSHTADATAPTRLLEIITEVLHRYAGPRLAGREATRAAAAAGRRLTDTRMLLPPAAAADIDHLTALLDEVNDACRDGLLLTLPPTEEVSAFRRWYTDEVGRQLAGAVPTPCPFPTVAPEDPATRFTIDPALVERAHRLAEERVADREALLHDIGEGLALASSVAAVADVILGRAMPGIGGNTGSFCLLRADGVTMDIVAQRGYPRDVQSHWGSFELAADVPASEAVRTGEAVLLRTVAEREVRYPIFQGSPVIGDEAIACLPLVHGDGTRVGALVFGFAAARDFAPGDRAFLARVADAAAAALVRVRRP